jgi:hypothetical protein
MKRLILILTLLTTTSNAGILLFAAAETDGERAYFSAILNNVAREDLRWPFMAPNNYAVTYTRNDTTWAAPGNGDKALTRATVNRIKAQLSNTGIIILYRDSGDMVDFTRVTKTLE